MLSIWTRSVSVGVRRDGGAAGQWSGGWWLGIEGQARSIGFLDLVSDQGWVGWLAVVGDWGWVFPLVGDGTGRPDFWLSWSVTSQQHRVVGGRDGEGDAVATTPARQWWWWWTSHTSLFRLVNAWVWGLLLGPNFFALMYFCFASFSCFLISIITHQLVVGCSGLCPELCTLSALFALGRQRVTVKWTLPPSGRMKHRATGNSGWLHSEKAELIGDLWLYMGMIFLVCRLYCKADGVASYAIPAKWCCLEYMTFVETLAIIVRGSLDAYCNLGFRQYVPPLY